VRNIQDPDCRATFFRRGCGGLLGHGRVAGAADGEGEGQRAQRPHRLQPARNRPLHLAAAHRVGDRAEGRPVHQVPLNK